MKSLQRSRPAATEICDGSKKIRLSGMLPNPDTVYLKNLTELGEQTEVRAAEDIRTENGLTLLTKGSRIDRAKLDRLVRHKLVKPIDTQVAVDDAVGHGLLVKEAIYQLRGIVDEAGRRWPESLQAETDQGDVIKALLQETSLSARSAQG